MSNAQIAPGLLGIGVFSFVAAKNCAACHDAQGRDLQQIVDETNASSAPRMKASGSNS